MNCAEVREFGMCVNCHSKIGGNEIFTHKKVLNQKNQINQNKPEKINLIEFKKTIQQKFYSLTKKNYQMHTSTPNFSHYYMIPSSIYEILYVLNHCQFLFLYFYNQHFELKNYNKYFSSDFSLSIN